MTPLPHSRKILAVMVALGGLSGLGRSAGFESLLRSAPFGRPGTAAGAPAGPLLEFRGVLVDGGREYFSIHEIKSRRSMWVGSNEPGQPFVVRGYDAARGILTVEYQDNLLALVLKDAVILNPSADSGRFGLDQSAALAPKAGSGYRIGHVAEEMARRRPAVQPLPPR